MRSLLIGESLGAAPLVARQGTMILTHCAFPPLRSRGPRRTQLFMTSIARLPLESPVVDPWRHIAAAVAGWAGDAGVALRDAVLLVPFAHHLPLARRAFAQAGGWMPRIETTMTLARSLAPPPQLHPSQLRFDAALDRLAARRLLRGQAFGQMLQ